MTVAIPDYTVTPAGADYGDPAGSTTGSWPHNAVMDRLAGERGIAFVDIFDISLRAADDRSLVADDGLHPSGAQYGLWVERLGPVVQRAARPLTLGIPDRRAVPGRPRGPVRQSPRAQDVQLVASGRRR